MKFPRRLPHFRSIKFAPVALVSLFLFSNLTGVLFSRALAPEAAATQHAFSIPSDIPSSGDPQLDRIIFEAAEEQGVDQDSCTPLSGRNPSTRLTLDRMRARRG